MQSCGAASNLLRRGVRRTRQAPRINNNGKSRDRYMHNCRVRSILILIIFHVDVHFNVAQATAMHTKMRRGALLIFASNCCIISTKFCINNLAFSIYTSYASYHCSIINFAFITCYSSRMDFAWSENLFSDFSAPLHFPIHRIGIWIRPEVMHV